MVTPDLKRRVEQLFLDDANTFGCAETALVVLQEHFALPGAGDSSAAMALNGGIAYSGGMCGAITGAALAVGRLAGRLIPDHARAKSEARRLTQALIADFAREYGATGCRELSGYDFMEPGRHHAFIESGVWRDACLRQIQFAVEVMSRLVAAADWARATIPPGPHAVSPPSLAPPPP
ncbi:MAG: C-GCAxxG-C-C family protein [Actinomycetota bacterium]